MRCRLDAHAWSAFATLICLGTTAAVEVSAQTSHIDWGLAAGVRHRTLTEWSSTGTRLLTEKGVVPHLRLTARTANERWPVLLMDASLGGARLDYQGRTQAGAPLDTTTRHSDRELALQWRPLPPASWGEAWVGLAGHSSRRAIASTNQAGGLTETSTLVMPGVRWRSPQFSISQGVPPLQVEAQWRASVRHRLAVDYGGVFDNSSLKGGRRSEALLRLSIAPTPAWQGSLEWGHTRQVASDAFPLHRVGAVVGSVRQPRLRIDDVSISLTRRF